MTGALQRVRRKHAEASTDARMHRQAYVAWRERLAKMGFDPAGKAVLDIGTGDRAPLALQLAIDGAEVTAVDLRPVRLGRARPRFWLSLLGSEGLREAVRVAAVDAIHTTRYWRELSRLSGARLPFRAIRMQVSDTTVLPFEDQTFDLVISSAVWEHIPDVRAATREVGRVLKMDGVVLIQIALFPALQGGHYPEWHDPSHPPRDLRPWEHLRRDGAPPPLYLNGWRESQYERVFRHELAVVDWEISEPQGGEFLDDQLRHELADYSLRELLTPWATAWCRKLEVGAPSADGEARRGARRGWRRRSE